MNILYSKSFGRDLDALQHGSRIKKRLLNLIEQIKKVDVLSDISGVKKIKGYPTPVSMKSIGTSCSSFKSCLKFFCVLCGESNPCLRPSAANLF